MIDGYIYIASLIASISTSCLHLPSTFSLMDVGLHQLEVEKSSAGWSAEASRTMDTTSLHRLKQIPSGKRLQNYGKSPFFMGKSTITMAIFNSELLVYQRVFECEFWIWMIYRWKKNLNRKKDWKDRLVFCLGMSRSIVVHWGQHSAVGWQRKVLSSWIMWIFLSKISGPKNCILQNWSSQEGTVFWAMYSFWWFLATPLKNDGVRQWGWDDIPYMKWKIKNVPVTTNQVLTPKKTPIIIGAKKFDCADYEMLMQT